MTARADDGHSFAFGVRRGYPAYAPRLPERAFAAGAVEERPSDNIVPCEWCLPYRMVVATVPADTAARYLLHAAFTPP